MSSSETAQINKVTMNWQARHRAFESILRAIRKFFRNRRASGTDVLGLTPAESHDHLNQVQA
jgi:hypothetical protein